MLDQQTERFLLGLTSEEQAAIRPVLERDLEFQRRERSRIRLLRTSVDLSKSDSLAREHRSRRESWEPDLPVAATGNTRRQCSHCHQPVGIFYNVGRRCRRCQLLTCVQCQKWTTKSHKRWLCSVCYQERELMAASGEWFHQSPADSHSTGYISETLLHRMRKISLTRRMLKLSPEQGLQSNSRQIMHGSHTNLRVPSNDRRGQKISVVRSAPVSPNKRLSLTDTNEEDLAPVQRKRSSSHTAFTYRPLQGLKSMKAGAMRESEEDVARTGTNIKAYSTEQIPCSGVKSYTTYHPATSDPELAQEPSDLLTTPIAQMLSLKPLHNWYPMNDSMETVSLEDRWNSRYEEDEPGSTASGFPLYSPKRSVSITSSIRSSHDPLFLLDSLSNSRKIRLGIYFNQKLSSLDVTICCCRNLPTVDQAGTAPNAFVKVNLHSGKQKPENSFRITSTCYQTQNPDFNQVLKFNGKTRLDFEQRQLELTVWHEELTGGSQWFLGQSRLQLTKAIMTPSNPFWLTLEQHQHYPVELIENPVPPDPIQHHVSNALKTQENAHLRLDLRFIGPPGVPPSAMFGDEVGKMQCTIISAWNLPKTFIQTSRTLFVKARLLLDKERNLRLYTPPSKSIQNECHWQSSLTFQYQQLNNLRDRTLIVGVWEKGVLGNKRCLGRVEINNSQHREGESNCPCDACSIWVEMLTAKNCESVQKELPLTLC